MLFRSSAFSMCPQLERDVRSQRDMQCCASLLREVMCTVERATRECSSARHFAVKIVNADGGAFAWDANPYCKPVSIYMNDVCLQRFDEEAAPQQYTHCPQYVSTSAMRADTPIVYSWYNVPPSHRSTVNDRVTPTTNPHIYNTGHPCLLWNVMCSGGWGACVQSLRGVRSTTSSPYTTHAPHSVSYTHTDSTCLPSTCWNCLTPYLTGIRTRKSLPQYTRAGPKQGVSDLAGRVCVGTKQELPAPGTAAGVRHPVCSSSQPERSLFRGGWRRLRCEGLGPIPPSPGIDGIDNVGSAMDFGTYCAAHVGSPQRSKLDQRAVRCKSDTVEGDA